MGKLKNFVRFLWLSTVAAIFAGGLFFSAIFLYLAPNLPSIDALREIKLQTPLRVYSRNLKLIGEFGEKRRNPIAIDKVPPLFIKAVLAAEDDRFFSHAGVDLKGLLRAASQLIATGKIQTGGSTITMQVARNFFLSNKKTFKRKFNEILLALLIERELNKNEILELYINKIYLGNRSYGLGAAAQVYYGKTVDELEIAQLAMIAGLPKAPSTYNPIANPERAKIRRDWILGRMLKLGYISQPQHDTAFNAPITASYHGLKLDLKAPYVAEMARKFAYEQFGSSAYTDGYKVVTTIDPDLQLVAQRAVRDGIVDYDLRHGYRGKAGHFPLPAQPQETGKKEPITLAAPSGEDTSIETGQKITSSTPGPEAELYEPVLEHLEKMPEYQGIIPAVVLNTTDDSLEVLTKDNQLTTIPWENTKNYLRAYISENQREPAPEKPESVFQRGDLIHVLEHDKDGLIVAQLPEAQAALVSMNPDNGAIVSIVGGFDFYQSKYNRALQAKRQPGSNFKPFFYITAFEQGFTAASLINDAPIVFDDNNLENMWRPENSSGKFYGPTRLRKALYKSRNLVSIRLLKSMGVKNAIEGATRFGFNEEELPADLSLALGSMAVPPLKVATAYASIANGGFRIKPFVVDKIADSFDNVIYEARPETVCRECEREAEQKTSEENSLDNLLSELPLLETELETGPDTGTTPDAPVTENPDSLADAPEGIRENTSMESEPEETKETLPPAERIVDGRVIHIMDSILRDVVQRGTATRAKALEREDIAGKTGTTNGPTDAWFSGYHPNLVVTTWLGFDNNSNLGRREFGGSAALPIWIDYMRKALEDLPQKPVEQPDEMVMVRINADTGERASPDDRNALFEIFRSEFAPEDNGQSALPDKTDDQGLTTESIF
jgi:penicillin-binding protein 1A